VIQISRRLAWLAAVGALALAGCSGDDGMDGAQGPVGPPGATGSDGTDAQPGPFSLMVLGGEAQGTVDTLVKGFTLAGVFAPGMTIVGMSVIAATPTANDLAPYDVVLVYSNSPFSDRDALGDALADYVDAGGRVVTGQYAYSVVASTFTLGGRFAADPYMPVATSDTGVTMGNFDVSSIAAPAHVVFHGVGVADFAFWGNGNYRDPALQAGTVLATDVNGYKMVTLNDAGTVLSLGLYPTNQFTSAGTPEARRLVANCLAFMAGALQ
jgi:hypothetical protein